MQLPAGFYKIKKRLLGRNNLLQCYNAAIRWIENHSQLGGGIAVTNYNQMSYPEVTGYYIPTLLHWGQKDRAVEWARWLLSIQETDGSWWDHQHTRPYTFDTGQILKGVRIGARAVIGAGAVVRSNIPPDAVVMGNPGRVVKRAMIAAATRPPSRPPRSEAKARTLMNCKLSIRAWRPESPRGEV